MFDELETLVGYVFVVGGRAVSAMPPGAVVELPPRNRKTQRSREQDTFFTLITPAGGTQAQASFYEQLARIAADLYFKSGGSVTSGMREVLTAIHNRLLEHDQSGAGHYEVSMACLVLRGHEVYAARVGQSLCVLYQDDELLCAPDQPSELMNIETSLGSPLPPEVKLARYEVGPGAILAVSDTGFAATKADQLRAALASGRTPQIVHELKTICAKSAQAMVIEFVAAGSPNPLPPVLPDRPISTKVPKTSPGAPSMPIAQPSVSMNAVSAPVLIPIAPVPDEDAPDAPDVPVTEGFEPLPASPAVVETAVPAPEVPTPNAPTDQPRSFPARALHLGGFVLGKIAQGINFGLDRVLPEPSENAGPRIPAMVAAGLAILVPIIVVFIVVALQLSQFDLTQFEQQVRDVEDAAQKAETISLQDVERARTAWNGILQRVDTVEKATGRTNDPSLMRIRARAINILDGFDHVTRLTPIPMRTYGNTGRLSHPIVQGGTDVYILDRAATAVYRDTFNERTRTLETRSAQPVIQKGQAVSSFAVRDLIDIAWMSEGGVQRPHVLAALDVQGLLVTYSPTFSPATAQRLGGIDKWGKPVAMFVWRSNLYLLDPTASQIWRYKAVGSSYPNPPEEYFDGYDRPDLSTAVDFAIDLPGNVYILFADGHLEKYWSGSKLLFGLSDMPDNKGLRSGTALFVDTDTAFPAIYILDADDQSVYQITLSGKFKYRFRSTDGSFSKLSGIYANRTQIFVSSGSSLYYFTIDSEQNK